MELELKNIGMIKEANIKLDGLTVIAGENDTGKSTVGKALFLVLKARTFAKHKKDNILSSKIKWLEIKIFKQNVINNNTFIKFILPNNDIIEYSKNYQKIGNKKFLEAIFIESPIIFNYYQTFKGIANANSILDFQIPYSYLSWDLYIKLAQKRDDNYKVNNHIKIIELIKRTINGDFIYKKTIGNERWIFSKNSKEYEMDNTATGIKQFGLLLSIFKNGYLTKDRILILDEPEVHLHPKWQLEYAKIVVELVKSGVKVLVTSHSPYMIEALKRYSEIKEIENKTNFYLAENGYIKHQDSLEDIFEKLVLPIRELKKLKMDRYLND